MTTITKAQALEALDSLDDYARMETGVDAHGPRETLRKFIEQQDDEFYTEDEMDAALDLALVKVPDKTP